MTTIADPRRGVRGQHYVDGESFIAEFTEAAGDPRSAALAELHQAQQEIEHARAALQSAQERLTEAACDHQDRGWTYADGGSIECDTCGIVVGHWDTVENGDGTEYRRQDYDVACNVDPLWRATLSEGVWMNEARDLWAAQHRTQGYWTAKDADGRLRAKAPTLASLPSETW